jgi:hypothetical protein
MSRADDLTQLTKRLGPQIARRAGVTSDVARTTMAATLDALEREGILRYGSMAPDSAGGGDELTERLLPQEPPIPSERALLMARRNAEARWRLLEEFGYRTGEQVGEGRSRASNRWAYASRLRRERKVFAVGWHGKTLYPAFQFDSVSGEPRRVVHDVLAALPVEEMTEWEVALWWASANGMLGGGERPVDLLDDDPAAVVEAARRECDRSPA